MFRVDPANLATSPAPAGVDGARALVERQLAMLNRLAEVGMEIVEAAGRQAAAPPAEGDDGAAALRDAGLTYSRVARAVRLTFALQTQLLKDLVDLEKAEAKTAYERNWRRREGLVRLAKQGLDAEYDGLTERDFDRYSQKVRERLRETEDYGDILGQSLPQAVAAICAELGLAPEWTARIVAAAGGDGEGASIPHPSSSDGAEGEDPRTQQAGREGSPSSSVMRLGPRVSTPEGATPEDDEDEEDTFLEWPPPSG